MRGDALTSVTPSCIDSVKVLPQSLCVYGTGCDRSDPPVHSFVFADNKYEAVTVYQAAQLCL